MRTPTANTELTVFYDASCAFCLKEMQKLAHWDKAQKLAFIDISLASFDPAVLGVSLAEMDAALHAQTRDGRMLVGLDAIRAAYQTANKAWLVAPLSVKFLLPGLNFLYRKFARHRYQISTFLGLRVEPVCRDGRCELKQPYFKQKP